VPSRLRHSAALAGAHRRENGGLAAQKNVRGDGPRCRDERRVNAGCSRGADAATAAPAPTNLTEGKKRGTLAGPPTFRVRGDGLEYLLLSGRAFTVHVRLSSPGIGQSPANRPASTIAAAPGSRPSLWALRPVSKPRFALSEWSSRGGSATACRNDNATMRAARQQCFVECRRSAHTTAGAASRADVALGFAERAGACGDARGNRGAPSGRTCAHPTIAAIALPHAAAPTRRDASRLPERDLDESIRRRA
jgi:hypothetical protein